MSVTAERKACLLYTSDAADERSSVDLGGRRIIKKKNTIHVHATQRTQIQAATRNRVENISSQHI